MTFCCRLNSSTPHSPLNEMSRPSMMMGFPPISLL
nr:MAG TPA_asm: hypothetical protein [Caudoviricetes sp.]